MKFDKKILIAGATTLLACAVSDAVPLPYWADGKEYRKELSADLVFSDLEADRWKSEHNLIFSGITKYTISRCGLKKAEVTFQESDLLRLEMSPTFKQPQSDYWFWATKIEPDIGKMFGTNAFKEETRSLFSTEDAKPPFCLVWENQKNHKSLNVKKDKNSPESPPKPVVDFLNMDCRFSYQSLTENREREERDWKIDADVLTGLVPQNMVKGGRFEGSLWVRWIDRSPEKIDEDKKLRDYDSKIIILNGHDGDESEVAFYFQSEDEKEQRVHIDSEKICGVFYVDAAEEIIASGKIEINDADYDGDMPQIGDFKEKNIEKLKAKVSLTFTYSQTSTVTME